MTSPFVFSPLFSLVEFSAAIMELQMAHFIPILIALIALGVVLILYNEGALFGSGSRSAKQRTIILAGPSNSGKTSLFLRWTGRQDPQVVTSQTVNRYDSLRLPFADEEKLKEVYSLVDIPGHARLQYLLNNELAASRNNLVGIVFVVDASGGEVAIENAAKYLYNLLKITEKRAGGVDIIIAANKFDVFNVISTTRITNLLEKYIDEYRTSGAKGLSEVKADEDSDDSTWIGGNGQFQFSQLEGRVTVVDGSVKANRLHKLESHVEELAANSF